MTTFSSSERLGLSGSARALLDAVVAISSDLDMHNVLDRLVASACELTGATYGALGVLGNSGGLMDFVTHGIPLAEANAIGHLPRGHGILGLLIEDPTPLRLRRIKDHPKSSGFPAHHPPMESFLGVPVRIRGSVFGNLYLTEKAGGAEFTEQDEMLVESLATAAGFVVDNARAYAQSERRRQWLEASAQITEALQPPVRVGDALHQIAISARRVSGASAVAVVQRRDDEHYIAACDGAESASVEELVTDVEHHIVEAEAAADVVVVSRGSSHTVVLVPLRAHLSDSGVLLVLLDAGRGALDSDEAELLASFADQASLALDRAQAINDHEELMLVSDRDRIARDLHDVVIQRLFATGLQLRSAATTLEEGEVPTRIEKAVAELDVTIHDIRSTIFDLRHAHEVSLRADLRSLVKDYAPVLGFSPVVRTAGPVDTAVPADIAEQALAVLREGLSNVARHSRARSAVVELEATSEVFVLRVSDDGLGLPAERRESGLRNVRRRATDRGGTFRLRERQPHGTVLEWTVPLR